jgi:hypothetical protein
LEALCNDVFVYQTIKTHLRALDIKKTTDIKTIAVNSVAATFAAANGFRTGEYR